MHNRRHLIGHEVQAAVRFQTKQLAAQQSFAVPADQNVLTAKSQGVFPGLDKVAAGDLGAPGKQGRDDVSQQFPPAPPVGLVPFRGWLPEMSPGWPAELRSPPRSNRCPAPRRRARCRPTPISTRMPAALRPFNRRSFGHLMRAVVIPSSAQHLTRASAPSPVMRPGTVRSRVERAQDQAESQRRSWRG